MDDEDRAEGEKEKEEKGESKPVRYITDEFRSHNFFVVRNEKCQLAFDVGCVERSR